MLVLSLGVVTQQKIYLLQKVIFIFQSVLFFFFLLNQLIIFSPQVLIEIKLFHLIIYRQPVTMGHK